MRSERAFRHWSEAGYNLFGPANRSHCLANKVGTTWEYRGFSASALLDKPAALPHYVNWLLALAYLSHHSECADMAPFELLVTAGFSDTAEYLRNVPHIHENLGRARRKLQAHQQWVNDWNAIFHRNTWIPVISTAVGGMTIARFEEINTGTTNVSEVNCRVRPYDTDSYMHHNVATIEAFCNTHGEVIATPPRQFIFNEEA
jgi:hypothetical protein